MQQYTGCFTKNDAGYIGQLIEWPVVIAEAATLEECKSMLANAAKEMISEHETLGLPIPQTAGEIARITVPA